MENVFTKYQKRINPTQQNLELWSLTIDQGLVAKTKRYDRSFLVRKNDIFNLVPKGYFVYNPMNITLGTIDVNKYHSIAVSGYYIVLKSNDQFNVAFLASLLHTSSMINKYKRFSTGSLLEKQRLQFPNFAKVKIISPRLSEQTKIGLLMNQVNNLIDLQQRKLEQLNLLQKYVKEKTLPSQKKLPKLRFLNTPYNTYKFSELFKKSTKKNDGQILQNHVISVASMRWGKLPKSSSEAYMKTYFIFNKGDIAYEGNRSKRYSFGRFVANDLGNGIVSHVFSVFNSKINFNLEFLKNYINSEQVMRDPLRMSTSRTTMMTNLVLKDIAKQTLMIPSKNEQDLLGSLYKITQSMIELNEKQQQELIYLKKYLLQKLFI
ncbi:restriction endonuclease subunit S [Limosilactobacillus reuteri]|nr:restriction endonuclease subunit S [Limosilactobacillus reuteri]MDD1406867.1 restriction endonuclease subunit S [Limosilactobacillus reuteri]